MSNQFPDDVLHENQAEAVRVGRRIPRPLDDVWAVLLTVEGAEALLGPGGRLGDKGHTWQAEDGSHGVTRSFHPREQIRFSWHRDDDAPATLVDVELSAAGKDSTQVEIIHDRLPEDVDRQQLAVRWNSALERISATSS